jgi:glycosyltransferase involved in cell wall biosynthesis
MYIGILGSRGFPSTYGGYETLVRYFARWLVAHGHDVTVYCRTRDEGRSSWVTEHVHCVATRGFDSKSLSTLSFGLTSSVHAAGQRYDAMLVLNIANGFYLPCLSRRVPVAVNTDGIEWERGKWGTAAKAAFRAGAALTAKHADALIADSVAIADVWQQRFGVPSTYVPYGAPILSGLDTNGLQTAGVEPGRYALLVARLIPENNVDLFLDAIESMGDGRPPTVVVGSANFDSPIEHRLKSLEDLGHITWLGHVDNQELLMRLWAHSGVYVHGHSVGGTNPALVQALGAGAPVLALDTVFNREVVRNEEQLFPADADRLAKQIRAVLASETKQQAMREHGQEVVAHHYQWDDICQRYFDVLARIAGHRR